MRYYCTYFDSNFLSRGLALYKSLCTHEKEFVLYVLCLDDKTHIFFQQNQFDYIIPIAHQKFEDGDLKLTNCKAGRSKVEYIFTCTPSLLRYILKEYNIELLTYLDSDLFFFSSPDPVFNEIGNSSIAIIAHRFSEQNKHLEIYGIYNVGFLSFRNDLEGRKCLEWWRDKCIEWCCDHVDCGRFADQKYLDEWPMLFDNVHVVTHKGANVASWNIDNYSCKVVDGISWVDDAALIFYHFHGLSSLGKYFFRTGIDVNYDNETAGMIDFIYRGYISYLKLVAKKYDTPVCGTRSLDCQTVSILGLSLRSEIICLFGLLPIFSVSRIVRKFQPVYKFALKLKTMLLSNQFTFQL